MVLPVLADDLTYGRPWITDATRALSVGCRRFLGSGRHTPDNLALSTHGEQLGSSSSHIEGFNQ